MPKIAKEKPAKIIPVKKFLAPSIYDIDFPKNYSIQKVGTSQSLLQNFLKCCMAYKLSLNLYRQYGAKNTTGFGSLVHDILDQLYTYHKETKRIASDKMIDAWIESFPTRYPEDLAGMTQQELEYALGVAYVIMTEYKVFYINDFKEFKFDEVETVGKVQYGEYILRNKVDGKFRKKKKKWIMEHKTKGFISDKNLLLQLSFDTQNLFYVTCEEIDHPDDPVEGVLYNVVRRPAHMQKKTESLPEFLVRLRSEVQKDPNHFFKRYEVRYTLHDKMIYRKELDVILSEANKLIKGESEVFKNTTACCGAWNCEYLDACSSGKMSGYIQTDKWFPELDIGL